MKLSEIAERFSCHIEGDGDIEISGVATLEDAQEGQISFFTNSKYLPEARATKASALIVGPEGLPFTKCIIKHTNPYLVFAKTLELFHAPRLSISQIHSTACISEKAKLGKNVSIGAFVFLADEVEIGDNVIVEPHCTILERVRIGNNSHIQAGAVIRQDVSIGTNCIIQSNVVIGSDGFGYAKQDDGSWYKIIQAGEVILEDNIEIGAGTTIDRATLGKTHIRTGTKLDNLVQIGHGSTIGEHTLLCAQVGLAGSTHVGNQVILTGQVGAVGHLKIGDRVIATGQTGIPGDVPEGTVISGSPGIDNKRWLRSTAIFAKLPELLKSIREIEKRLKELEKHQVKL
jgi:UDP-3-O-[3-hydroxymyristoyl] glucosamine N-acyltransferase